MFVLLQICPQAIGPGDLQEPIDAIAVDASYERLEEYLLTYKERHRVACEELEARLEEHGDAWEAVHDHDEIADKHGIRSTLISEPDTIFEIFAVEEGVLPAPAGTEQTSETG